MNYFAEYPSCKAKNAKSVKLNTRVINLRICDVSKNALFWYKMPFKRCFLTLEGQHLDLGRSENRPYKVEKSTMKRYPLKGLNSDIYNQINQ